MLPIAAAIDAGYLAISAFHDYEMRGKIASALAAIEPVRAEVEAELPMAVRKRCPVEVAMGRLPSR